MNKVAREPSFSESSPENSDMAKPANHADIRAYPRYVPTFPRYVFSTMLASNMLVNISCNSEYAKIMMSKYNTLLTMMLLRVNGREHKRMSYPSLSVCLNSSIPLHVPNTNIPTLQKPYAIY